MKGGEGGVETPAASRSSRTAPAARWSFARSDDPRVPGALRVFTHRIVFGPGGRERRILGPAGTAFEPHLGAWRAQSGRCVAGLGWPAWLAIFLEFGRFGVLIWSV